MDFRGRKQKLLKVLEGDRLDALIVTHLANVRYACGFTGSAGLLVIAPGRSAFFTDGRYTEQARAQVQGAKVIIAKGSALKAAASWLNDENVHAVGIESDHMTVATHLALRQQLGKGARIRTTSGLIEKLRVVKEPEEVQEIRRAVVLGAGLLKNALKVLKPGVAEAEVAAAIEFGARESGAEGMSFNTIVAAGARSALPHGRASASPVPRKGFVVMDFGVILAGYCSDMTRTVHVGKASTKARQLYEAVREAQQVGIDAVRAGVPAGTVDSATRKVLTKAGLGKYFTHSTGHGVGLEIHEVPRIGRGATDLLEPGMVITIEPGAYIPGEGGARIEDMVLVTENGCEVLTPARKELITV